MRRKNSRNKKYNIPPQINNTKNQRSKGRKNKNYFDSYFEKQEVFYSEREPDEKKIIKNKLLNNGNINHNEQDSIFSEKKHRKHNKMIIDNKEALEDDINSVRSERNLRRKCEQNCNLCNSLTIEIDVPKDFSKNKRNNNRNQTKNIINLEKDLKKAKSRKEKVKKNNNLNINNEFPNEPIEENKSRKRTTSLFTTRNLNNKIENVKKPEMNKKNKSKKGNNRKYKNKKEEKESNNLFILNNKNKSRSYWPNSNRGKKGKKLKEKENNKNKVTKRNKRDYSSPRIYLENNRSMILDNEMDEEINNLKTCSSEKKINHKKSINNKITKSFTYFTYSNPVIDNKNFIITLEKHLVIDIPKSILSNDIINMINDLKLLGRKRRRQQNKKEKETKNNKLLNKNKKAKIKETKDIKEKNNLKGKSLFSVMIKKEDDDNNSQISNKYDVLKNELNCDRNRGVRIGVKQGTRKHKSLKKEKNNRFVKFSKDLNSVDSYSEPDKDFYNNDIFSQRNNYNLKVANQSNDPMQIDDDQNNYNSNMKTDFNSNPRTSNINNNNNNKNSSNKDINKSSFNLLGDTSNINYINIDSNCNSLNLNSETANFMGSSNNFEYSFPLDLEEKVDLKEDKNYYINASKYIKYNPIDKYLHPLSDQKKKPYTAKIMVSHTNQISFTKNKNKINSIDSDNDITDITSSNNEYNNYSTEYPSILNFPRIKPFREEHIKMIKDKLNQDGIKLYPNDDKNLHDDEKNNYLGSFVIYDEKNNIRVTIPCFKTNEKTKEFFNNKRLKIIEFQEDNDINTDEEQLELEVQRNDKALLFFMNKVSKNKNYVDKNLVRKKNK